ncbi:lysozyme-like [Achroia grisella]|uniref:lysozyme-like n=1 Tax=Achroia grisella TaxID=688607 RepID=UPI0027D22195|nr:lysozyme-like [Achroia grisella]
MDKLILIVIVTLAFTSYVNAKTFTRCGLVGALRSQGFDEANLRDWVCLVESESSRRTDVVGKPNKDGSRDYGLFQINDRYWCSNTSTAGKDCNITCSQLLTDDITVASKCAKKIYKRHRFLAWRGWTKHCQNKPLPDISNC